MAARLTALIVGGIVAVTLIAGLIVGAQRDDDTGPVDVLILNGRVYPGDGDGTFAEAVAIQANRVLRIGSNRDLKRLRGLGTTVIDAHGGTVLPGFNDAHAHVLAGGLARGTLDLRSAASLDAIERDLRAYADAHPNAKWIVGRGWRFTAFPESLPTRRQLDLVVPDRPVYLVAEDGRTAWVNTKALAAARITRRTENPPHGFIVRDPRTAEPTGILKEAARTLVEQVLPKPTEDRQIEALKAAIADAHRRGITSVQDAGGTPYQLELYEDLRRDDELKVRVYGFVEIRPGFNPGNVDQLDRLQNTYPDDPLLKAGAVRLTLDGSIETQSAAMLAPHAAGHPSSVRRASEQSARFHASRLARQLFFSADELSKIVAALDRKGWQIAIEAAGDAAVRAALDAFERAGQANPLPARGRRHRIERIDAVDAGDAGRFQTGGIVASLQPQRALAAPEPLLLRALNPGAERASSRGWSWTPITEAGGAAAFGSDWPDGAFDPLTGVQLAMTAGSPAVEESDSERRIRLTSALDAYTRGAAYASFDEQRKGTLARGMLADLVILSTDIFSLPPDRLSDARVEYTIFDGKVVYSRVRETTDR